MNIRELEKKLSIGLHYDNLLSLIEDCHRGMSENGEFALAYHAIGCILQQLADGMDPQAVSSETLHSAEAFLMPLLKDALGKLTNDSSEARWDTLNELVTKWQNQKVGI